jgi:hypothetical protein
MYSLVKLVITLPEELFTKWMEAKALITSIATIIAKFLYVYFN